MAIGVKLEREEKEKTVYCHIIYNDDGQSRESASQKIVDKLKVMDKFEVNLHLNLNFESTLHVLEKEIFPLDSKELFDDFGFDPQDFDNSPKYQHCKIFMLMVYTFGSR